MFFVAVPESEEETEPVVVPETLILPSVPENVGVTLNSVPENEPEIATFVPVNEGVESKDAVSVNTLPLKEPDSVTFGLDILPAGV